MVLYQKVLKVGIPEICYLNCQCNRVSKMKNSVDPDQAAPLRSSLIWACTVFKVFSILNIF